MAAFGEYALDICFAGPIKMICVVGGFEHFALLPHGEKLLFADVSVAVIGEKVRRSDGGVTDQFLEFVRDFQQAVDDFVFSASGGADKDNNTAIIIAAIVAVIVVVAVVVIVIKKKK